MTRVTWHCPECDGQNVQSTGWMRWNVAEQRWEDTGDDPPNDDYWCEDCQDHMNELVVRQKEEIEDGSVLESGELGQA